MNAFFCCLFGHLFFYTEIQDKCVFAFYAEIQDFRQNGKKTVFGKSCQLPPQIPWEVKNFIEFALSHTVSEINALECFMLKSKMASDNGGKRFLRKVTSRLCKYPGGSKILPKSLYLTPFPR